VPGGTGYVGGRACEALAHAGWRVRVASRRARAWPGPSSSDIEVLACDWREPTQRARLIEGCEALLMLAAANEIDAAHDPAAAEEATSGQCLGWLESARGTALRRFVYLSTIHVYGAVQEEGPISETSPALPRHPYASAHLAAERFVHESSARGELPSTIFRLSNTFGAPVDPQVDRWSLLVNDLARQAVERGRLELRSDGLQARDFVPMATVCDALRWSLDTTQSDGLFNLGSGRSTTVFDMATRIADRCGAVLGFRPPIVRPEPAPGANPGRFRLDVGALQRAGGLVEHDWEPEIDALLRFCSTHFGARR
jgi:UDP-glucose 4-epimerase